jgi:hypothetical protein
VRLVKGLAGGRGRGNYSIVLGQGQVAVCGDSGDESSVLTSRSYL